MAVSDEKNDSRGQHIDQVADHSDGGDKMMFNEEDPNVDYTGVAKKTDPEEIKLVRKLDYRIMVSFSIHIIHLETLLTMTNSRHSVSCISSTMSIEMPSPKLVSTTWRRIWV